MSTDIFEIGYKIVDDNTIYVYKFTPEILDLIKTKYQAIKNNSDTKVINVIKEIYKNYGYRGFYHGFKYAIMRAIPLHGGVFLGYEFSKQFYKNNF